MAAGPGDEHALTVNRAFFADDDAYAAFCEAVINVADVGLLVLDRHGNFVMRNPSVRAMMAKAFPDGHEGVAGQTGDLYQLDGVTEVPHEMLPSTRATRGEEFDDYLIWMGRDPELRRALSVSARLMRDKDGEPDGAVLITRDITEVTRAVSAREDFLATISHELRTPLTSLLGYLELADEEAGRSVDVVSVRTHLDIAQRNGRRLLKLVDELLNAATLGQGVDLTRRTVDVCEVVARAVESVAVSAANAEIDLTCAPGSGTTAWIDEHRITEVLENLLTNAIKFTPRGGSVEVSCAEDGPDVTITVRDTGIGIQPGDRSAVFERFFRSSGVQERAIQGVGLGLHIVKLIVEAHGGSIGAVPNDDGPGTEILVRLPRGPVL